MKTDTALYRADRNINGHAEARVARLLYNVEYAAQHGGLMDFWDTLTDGQKNTCRKCLDEILEARKEVRP